MDAQQERLDGYWLASKPPKQKLTPISNASTFRGGPHGNADTSCKRSCVIRWQGCPMCLTMQLDKQLPRPHFHVIAFTPTFVIAAFQLPFFAPSDSKKRCIIRSNYNPIIMCTLGYGATNALLATRTLLRLLQRVMFMILALGLSKFFK